MAIPRGFSEQMPGLASTYFGAKPEFNPLAPWTFWLAGGRDVATHVVTGGVP